MGLEHFVPAVFIEFLKKKEVECNQLWETLRDMHISSKKLYDARQLNDLLAIRQLDSKAKRKLKV